MWVATRHILRFAAAARMCLSEAPMHAAVTGTIFRPAEHLRSSDHEALAVRLAAPLYSGSDSRKRSSSRTSHRKR